MKTGVLEIRPPRAPLTWLHPELAELETPDPDALDLGADPRRGEMLIDAIEERGPSSVAVPPTPRGRTLASVLGRPLRERGIEVHAKPGKHTPLEYLLSREVDRVPKMVPLPSGLQALVIPSSASAGVLHELAASGRSATEETSPIPVFLTGAPRPPSSRVTSRVPVSWFGIVPGDVYPEPVRFAAREVMRAHCPGRFFTWLAFENLALAGVDLYAEALMGRWRRSPRTDLRPRARVFAIDGSDGSGKSTHVAALREHLESRGLRVATHKLFRHGVFHDTVTDLTRQCAGGNNLHLWRLQRIIKAFDSIKTFESRVRPDLNSCDVVLFDRWIPTHLAAGTGRYHHDPWTREILSVLPDVDGLFLLDLSPEQALARIDRRQHRTVDENPYMLSRYRDAFRGMAARQHMVVLDAAAPEPENRRLIRETVDRALGGSAR